MLEVLLDQKGALCTDRGEVLMIIKNLVRTCIACPSQWEAETDDGRTVYIRFRWGCLTIGIGSNIEEAVRARPIFRQQVSDGLDGLMEDEEMLQHAGLILQE